MRLIVKKGDESVNELTFKDGPIYIGRNRESQIFLPDLTVSRQHAVIYSAGGKWIAQDLNSVNKTFLNDAEIDKVQIKNGDVLRITNFKIEIYID